MCSLLTGSPDLDRFLEGEEERTLYDKEKNDFLEVKAEYEIRREVLVEELKQKLERERFGH